MSHFIKKLRLTIGLNVLFVIQLIAQDVPTIKPDALMLRFPDVSRDNITFVYAEDVWVVSKSGGIAKRITSAKGLESFPKFSPDGAKIAFSANYDGNTDIYVIPSIGGRIDRLTHHPDTETMIDWYPDGSDILFASRMESYSQRFNQFYKLSVHGGLPDKLPLAYAEFGCLSPDGTQLAYQYLNRQFRNWKRYQGGTASDIWIHDFAKDQSTKITEYPGTDAMPMWHDNKIFFISDRGAEMRLNLWSYDLTSRQFKQETNFTDYDVKFPSLGPDDIVFSNGGKLYLFAFADGKTTEVKIEVPSELLNARAQFKKLNGNIYNFSLSPSGKRALFEARGEVMTVPAENGPNYDLTNSSGAAERSPSWSPDGKYIAYFSDETGEYELYIKSAQDFNKILKITNDGSMFRYGIVWSPDSKSMAFADNQGAIYIIDAVSGVQQNVDMDEYANFVTDYHWSPDSRWLVYGKHKSLLNNQLYVYDTSTKQKHELTSGFYNDNNPVFSPDGKYLYFLSNRHFRPIYSDVDATWVYPNATMLFVAPLKSDVKSPVAPENDEEKINGEDKKKDEDTTDDKKDKKSKKNQSKEKSDEDKKKEEVKVDIDFENFEFRATEMPVEPGNLAAISVVEDKVIYLRNPLAGTGKQGKPESTLVYYDFKDKKEQTIIDGIDAYDISADGKKVIYRSSSTYGIIDVAKDKKVGDGKLNMSDFRAFIDPQQEWKQIFNEAWRFERDFFYDPDMHGIDWKAQRERYAKLLPYATSRGDLNYIIGQMLGELNVGHAYVGGGDLENGDQMGVGMLGVDFKFDSTNNAYQIAKIYHGADWDVTTRSPLDDPGVNVKEGDYLLAVNRERIDASQDPWAAFQGLDNKTVVLTVNKSPGFSDARDVVVKTLSSESSLRNTAWIENNREKVFKATNGRIGYIYVPNTGIQGQSELVRMFQGQYDMDGLIVDERFNSGGQVPDRFIELLNRPVLNYWNRRNRKNSTTPSVTNDGPKVMLTNEWAGSGGDAFPYYFKETKVGPVVGKRTWGGLVGYSGLPPLIDGGFLTAPNFAFYNLNGKWDVEGYGVDPDYVVENPPDVVGRGEDPQLEKAIELVNKALETWPKKQPTPPYPKKLGLGNN